MARCGWKESGTTMFQSLANGSSSRRSVLSRLRNQGFAFVVLIFPLTLLAQSSPTIRVDVNLVHAVATVRTQSGQLVGDLEKNDFEVYDNGGKQEIAVFEHQTEQALSVALLIDTSGSTAKELKYEADASTRFVHALLGEGNPKDALSL